MAGRRKLGSASLKTGRLIWPCLAGERGPDGRGKWPYAEELRKVKKELKNFSPSYVIWDAEDLSLTPPWGNNISSDITDLSNYFVTSDGRDLISVLSEAMNEAKEMQCDIEIDNL